MTLFGRFRHNMFEFASKIVTIYAFLWTFNEIISFPDEE